ncbi:MAG TPA: prepilin-type N-terminal cleavage/methylation domain-containing protein [Candidatus Sumerlaeota bacterium]|nr:prepilin-type N-terminal cleavage/methylation domain-containing protein [Candidatus Sumerlaeota bacterium]HRR31826.1 prepilin-type N-terminal cleavage/methylation domain-containing protein [Candidatus Sumerlaeia bacterium]HON49308.1 prepilin-type N-terminal cleavage/methylation domain-containing protein [Candidatus Sumerlaeota bacterium]HOR64944.1 prepilin-type N-terminal cleavage/methylation domain-containing protein [Candidatus Sumerlaeota bacterium]HPL73097.1 prepilin-type N-terminal clea
MKKKGFTLIELLIVVAIIAILAAIAVPNFLEAQVRSKVSRARADMRSLATALEAYATDNNGFPPMGDRVPTQAWDPLPAEPIFHSRISSYLTTPNAYITSLMYDPFMVLETAQIAYPNIYRRYTYYNYKQYLDCYPTNATFQNYYHNRAGSWLLYSWGPDRAGNWSGSPPTGEDGVYTNYDPTNGTISIGNIIRTQFTSDKFKKT